MLEAESEEEEMLEAESTEGALSISRVGRNFLHNRHLFAAESDRIEEEMGKLGIGEMLELERAQSVSEHLQHKAVDANRGKKAQHQQDQKMLPRRPKEHQQEQEHVAKTKVYGKGKDGDKGGGKSKDGGKDGGKSKDGGKGGGKSKDGGKGGGKGKKRDFDGAFDNVTSTIESLSSAVTALLQSSSGSSSSALALGRASATADFGPMTISGEDVQKFKMIQDSVVRAKRSTQNTHRMLQSLAAQMQEETEILSAAETFLQETFSRWRRP